MSDTGFIEYDCNKITYRFEQLDNGVADLVIGNRYYVAITADIRGSACYWFADTMHLPDPFIIPMQKRFLETRNIHVTAIDILGMGEGYVEFRNVRSGIEAKIVYKDNQIVDHYKLTDIH